MQGKPEEAEQMFIRVLAGMEKARGPNFSSTLNTAYYLGLLYHDSYTRRHRCYNVFKVDIVHQGYGW